MLKLQQGGWDGAQCQDLPDTLCMPHCLAYGGVEGEPPGFSGCSERGRALVAAACAGTDAPLAVPLPHTRMLQRSRRGAPSLHASLPACLAAAGPLLFCSFYGSVKVQD